MRWRSAISIAAGLGWLLLQGCAGVSPTPVRSPMEELPTLGAYVPDEVDYAVRDLAAATLVSDAEGAAAALARLEGFEARRRAEKKPPTGTLPYARDAIHASIEDERLRRDATRRLTESGELDPALEARLEQEIADDPLSLAGARIKDARISHWGRIANSMMAPVGRSLVNGAVLPFRLLQSLVGIAITEHGEDELSRPERQALSHWKWFLDRHPDAPEAAALVKRVEASQRRWYRTQRDDTLRRAQRALEQGKPALALALAERALRYAPEDEAASALLAQAEIETQRDRANRAASLAAPHQAGGDDPRRRDLALALLLPESPLEPIAREILAEDPPSPLAQEAAFALAMVAWERGSEKQAWKRLEEVRKAGDERSGMARHAAFLLTSPDQNPYAAFGRAIRADRGDRARWLFFGPLARGARDRNMPRALEWAVEIPYLPQVVTAFPNRLLSFPFLKATRRSPGVFARRYLERVPEGVHAEELRHWLQDFEAGRGNYVGALRMAEARRDEVPARVEELRQRAGDQALGAANRESNLATRLALLRQVAREFRGTSAGQEAGEQVRSQMEEATAQHIRISRGFLLENRRVAGPEGLALRPELLDEELANGELHEDGIALLGGGAIEFAFVGPSGNDGAPPERQRHQISAERLARLVALLEETSLRSALVDPDYPVEHDADRDLFFERARLGVAETAHPRATARSSYSFRGMRERYGLVRSRESVLPVEIVLQGSFEDFGLGAFPRIRMPKPTPDAFLYE